MFSRVLLLFGFGAVSLLASPTAAQQQIGTTHRVTPAAHGSVAGTLAVGSGVHADKTIGPTREVLPACAFTISPPWTSDQTRACGSTKFIYDSNRSGGKAVFDAAKGSFRFSTGAQGGNPNIQIKTPVGTLGVRG
jgi:hypothetical protein